MARTRSARLFLQARQLMPGGVSSPVRAFGAVGGEPVYFVRGKGSSLWDADGNRYIDYVGGWGPHLLGHAPPGVVRAVRKTAALGMGFGACHPLEVELARLVRSAFPSIEKMRFVCSGTEGVMSAVRLARAHTGRELVVKFIGGYHGHSDGLLSQAGSGMATFGIPESPGVPASFAAKTIPLPYNDVAAAEECFKIQGKQIAAVLVEPVAGNMGVVPPAPGFLKALRALTREHGALLVFDEVITGFRVAWGGAQELYGVRPDLTVLGKILGGGAPVGAYGGPEEIMSKVAPEGPVYQAGTLSGNPVALAAGVAALKAIRARPPYRKLETLGAKLGDGLRMIARQMRVPATVNRAGSLLTVFFCEGPVRNYDEAARSDRARYAKLFQGMLERGIYLPPSALEAWFLSAAHAPRDVSRTLAAFRASL